MITTKGPYNVTVARYTCAADVADVAEPSYRRWPADYGDGDEWAGGTFAQAVADIRDTPRCMPRVLELFNALDAQPRGHAPAWVPGVVGAYPIVGDFLAGMPEHMRRKQLVESDLSPLRVFVGLGMRADVNAETMEKRGTAIAALCARLAEVRPLELYAYCDDSHGNDNVLHIIPLSTSPLDLSAIAATIGAPGCRRHLMFSCLNAILERQTSKIPALWRGNRADADYNRKLRELLGANAGDFVMRSGDYKTTDEIKADPIAWTQRTFSELSALGIES